MWSLVAGALGACDAGGDGDLPPDSAPAHRDGPPDAPLSDAGAASAVDGGPAVAPDVAPPPAPDGGSPVSPDMAPALPPDTGSPPAPDMRADAPPDQGAPPTPDARPPTPPDLGPDAAPPCEPRDEVCDGVDNDCDGEVDEGLVQACYGGLPATRDIGLCASGEQTCAAGRWGRCLGERLPSREVCNGLDDDCDGAADVDFAVGEACVVGVGACAATAAWICDPATGGVTCPASPGEPSPETCDGEDNDCDGVPDNGFDVGAACAVGIGACRSAGGLVCDAAGSGTVCDAVAGAPVPEVCDGEDNDCDGETDEPDEPETDLCDAAHVCVRGACGERAPPGYVRIEPGTFIMGSPLEEIGHYGHNGGDDPWRAEVQHTVTLTRPFAMKTTEVTQREWQAVMGNNPSRFVECGEDCPVERVNWYDAVGYANGLSDAEGLPRCYQGVDLDFAGLDCAGYRLPTEAEWEYSARAGTTTAFNTGPLLHYVQCGIDPVLDLAGWYCGNSGDPFHDVHPVAQKQPNAWGLYDMHGNVEEWVHDATGPPLGRNLVDPISVFFTAARYLRGGSCANYAINARSAARTSTLADDGSVWRGFRTVRTLR